MIYNQGYETNYLETEGMTRVGFEKSSLDFPVFILVVFKKILRENNGWIFFLWDFYTIVLYNLLL